MDLCIMRGIKTAVIAVILQQCHNDNVMMLRDISDTVCPVADKELVEETPCEPDQPEDDCEEVNKKFLERCLKYRNCPLEGEDPVFVCQQKQCVSR